MLTKYIITMERRKPKFEQFKLEKVKLLKTAGLSVEYGIDEAFGNEVYHNKSNYSSDKEPHPDLTVIFKKFRPIVARILHLTDYTDFVVRNEGNDEQVKAANAIDGENVQKIRINGISLHGSNENEGCKILALYNPDNYQCLAINPTVKFNAETYGFEPTVVELVDGLKKEVYAYLFDDKKAQMELFDMTALGGELEPEVIEIPVEVEQSPE